MAPSRTAPIDIPVKAETATKNSVGEILQYFGIESTAKRCAYLKKLESPKSVTWGRIYSMSNDLTVWKTHRMRVKIFGA